MTNEDTLRGLKRELWRKIGSLAASLLNLAMFLGFGYAMLISHNQEDMIAFGVLYLSGRLWQIERDIEG